jgi:hypothetical protein
MNNFEDRLRQLRLAEPSDGYEERIKSAIRMKAPRRPNSWVWGLAALLVLSITLNLYQLANVSQISRSVKPSFVDLHQDGIRVMQVQSVYVPGGQNRPNVKAKEYF